MANVMLMPLLSDTMTEGTVAAWHKKVGDRVEVGELLLEIETDKAVMEQDSFFTGTLLYIGVQTGESVPVNAVLAVVGAPNEDYKPALEAALNGKKTSAPAAPATAEAIPAAEEPATAEEVRLKASPLARKMAAETGVNLATLKGTGDAGRIVKRDVESARLAVVPQPKAEVPAPVAAAPVVVEAPKPPVVAVQPVVPAAVPAPAAPAFQTFDGRPAYEDVMLSQMRKTIARRLGESKFSAPHFYLTISVNMDAAMDIRKRLNDVSPVKISFNDLVVKAAAAALRQHPAVNSSWLGDRIRYNRVINVGVAVAVEEGLLVPVVHHADMKSLSQIAADVKTFAAKAKDRKLQPQDMQGNTFTISNLGMFGIEEFTAIINPPDSCIMAVGAIVATPIVVNGEIKIGNLMKVTLSCDHRTVDGASGAQFLQTFKQIIEDPIRLLV